MTASSSAVPLSERDTSSTSLANLIVERQRAELCDQVTILGDDWRAHLDDFIAARRALLGEGAK